MPERVVERRRHVRRSGAHPVAFVDRNGRVRLRARTSNISEGGLHCLTRSRHALRLRGRVTVEIELPVPSRRPGRCETRTVRYSGRVVRTEALGQFVGVAVSFLRKLDGSRRR